MKDDKTKPMTDRQKRQLDKLGVKYDPSWTVHQANRAANKAIVRIERQKVTP